MKKLTALLLSIAILLTLSACGIEKIQNVEVATEPVTEKPLPVTRVDSLYGPTGMGMAKIKAESKEFNVTFHSDPQEIVPLLVNGETDIAALPLNLAANLYNKTNGKIQILAINTLGVLHIIENGNTIQSVNDLKGKKIYATGQGSTPEYVLNFILESNGIDPKNDVEIEYRSAHPEVASLAVENKIEIALLPEPFVSKVLSANQNFREALDLTNEWAKVSESELAMGCVVVRKDFAESNPAVIEKFMKLNKESVDFINSSPKAGKMLQSLGFFDNEALALKTIPGCNIVFINGEEMKKYAQENFEILFKANPASIGGKLPDENIFCIK